MKDSTKLILGVVGFIVMMNSIVGIITYNSMVESSEDLKSFKELSCDGQKELLQDHEVSRDMTDETEYFMSECVHKDNSYQENQLRIEQKNKLLWENFPYLVLALVIPFGLWYGINRYYQWGLKEQKKDQERQNYNSVKGENN